ncbi:MAG: hypothetical protein K0U68_15770 [Gammaproteobacteria bacterium]|nr:hypothetical protein [Gammaproteobacteria bacterium]
MNSVKRLFISIKHRIDTVAEDFEDHQALIAAAIAELDEVGANTQVQLNNVRHEVVNFEKRTQAIEAEIDLWTDRAKAIREQDENKALDCVKRIRVLQAERQRVNEQFNHSIELERQLINDLEAIKAKRSELKIRKDSLHRRENRTGADQVLAGSENGIVNQADKILERWESRVVTREYQTQSDQQSNYQATVDPLQHEFEQQEDDQQLKAMLDELTNNTDHDNQ